MERKVDGDAAALSVELADHVAPQVAAGRQAVDEKRRAARAAGVDAAGRAGPGVNWRRYWSRDSAVVGTSCLLSLASVSVRCSVPGKETDCRSNCCRPAVGLSMGFLGQGHEQKRGAGPDNPGTVDRGGHPTVCLTRLRRHVDRGRTGRVRRQPRVALPPLQRQRSLVPGGHGGCRRPGHRASGRGDGRRAGPDGGLADRLPGLDPAGRRPRRPSDRAHRRCRRSWAGNAGGNWTNRAPWE